MLSGFIKKAFLTESKAFDAPSLLEKLIDFDREISVVAARNASGEIKVFPTVELVFNPKYNLVDYLIAPSSLSQEIQDKVFGNTMAEILNL